MAACAAGGIATNGGALVIIVIVVVGAEVFITALTALTCAGVTITAGVITEVGVEKLPVEPLITPLAAPALETPPALTGN
jgi:hypothetical protein